MGIAGHARLIAGLLALFGVSILPGCISFSASSTPLPAYGKGHDTPSETRQTNEPHSGTSARAPTPSLLPSTALPAKPSQDGRQPTHLPVTPSAGDRGKPFPINLPTALTLAGANPLDIQIAQERLEASAAAMARANVLWLPNISAGV